jgi:membrane-associated phospholipid phosphatase
MTLHTFRQLVADNRLFSILVLSFCLLGAVLPEFDYELTLWVSRHQNPDFTRFMGRSFFESGLPGGADLVIFGMLAALAGYLLASFAEGPKALRNWLPSLGFAVFGAIVSAVCLVHGTKWIVGRARPKEVVYKQLAYSDWFETGVHFINEGHYSGSFPSGHTLAAFLLMLAAYALAGDPQHSRRLKLSGWCVGALAVAYAGTMSVARAMSLNHWVSDCLLGMLLAWMLMHLCYYWVLRVPAQNRLRRTGQESRSPRLFELRLGLLVLGCTAGVTLALLGLRAVFLLQIHPLVLLLPVGTLMAVFFIRSASSLYSSFQERVLHTGGDHDA